MEKERKTMPYIAVRSYPKDAAVKKAAVEKLNQALQEALGCPAGAITISWEDIQKEDWAEQVEQPIILPNLDKMMILKGIPTEKMG